jgi:hypothetical protein
LHTVEIPRRASNERTRCIKDDEGMGTR